MEGENFRNARMCVPLRGQARVRLSGCGAESPTVLIF